MFSLNKAFFNCFAHLNKLEVNQVNFKTFQTFKFNISKLEIKKLNILGKKLRELRFINPINLN